MHLFGNAVFDFCFAMMKLTLSLLLLIAIWPPIASVTTIDVNDDPRYLAARELRNETRADWVEENELAFRKCVNKMNPYAQRVQLVVDAAHCPPCGRPFYQRRHGSHSGFGVNR